MALLKWHLFFLACWPVLVTCKMDMPPPDDFIQCVTSVSLKARNVTSEYVAMSSPDEIQLYCMKQFIWQSNKVDWSKRNISQEQMDMINRHIESLLQRGGRGGRVKRQAHVRIGFPRTGFRIRQEYRRLTPWQRNEFHRAVNLMKDSGEWNTFALIHDGAMITTAAHNGPAFFGWHRAYLALLEEALRFHVPWVSLPYWDSSMDFDMNEPTDSIVWSSFMLGNGNGLVITGPFAHWPTRPGWPNLMRSIGGGSSLISKEVIMAILSMCRTTEISDPTAPIATNLEMAHDGVHVWVGGHMGGVPSAPHDPVFYMHHAFIDYIWELFRIRQAFWCGINPETDYPPVPPTPPEQEANLPMYNIPQFLNIDGYSNLWTWFWYRYERSPTCSMFNPWCGSPLLWCDTSRGRCVSRERTWMGMGGMGGGTMGYGASDGPSTMETRMRGAMEEANFDFGPRFIGPPSEPRTLDAMTGGRIGRRPGIMGGMGHGGFMGGIGRRGFMGGMGIGNMGKMRKMGKMGKRKRRAVPENHVAYNDSFSQGGLSSRFGSLFEGPPPPVDRQRYRPNSAAGQTVPGYQQWDNQNAYSMNVPLLPTIDFSIIHNSESRRWYKPNDNTNDGTMKTYLPLRIVYVHTKQQGDALWNLRRNMLISTNTSFQQPQQADCMSPPSGITRVTVQSTGINYMGSYSNAVNVDTRRPRSSVTTYVQVDAPASGETGVMLEAYHACGLMCQAACVIPGTSPARYTSCNGILKIAEGDNTLIHGQTLEASLDGMGQRSGQTGGRSQREPKMIFQCSNADVSSWSQLAYSPLLGI